jgi:hypothetical protein
MEFNLSSRTHSCDRSYDGQHGAGLARFLNNAITN